MFERILPNQRASQYFALCLKKKNKGNVNKTSKKKVECDKRNNKSTQYVQILIVSYYVFT